MLSVSVICETDCETFEQWFGLRAMLYSFSLSRVSYKGEFLLERFLMRQHCTNNSFILSHLLFCWLGFGHLEFVKFLT